MRGQVSESDPAAELSSEDFVMSKCCGGTGADTIIWAAGIGNLPVGDPGADG